MGKVVQMPGISGAVSPREVVTYALSYAQLGMIQHSTFRLAAIICQEMQSSASRQVSMELRHAENTVITTQGGVIAGPFRPKTGAEIVEVLVEMHRLIGVYSALSLEDIEKPDICERSFALSPSITYGRDWNTRTRIHFKLTDVGGESYGDFAKKTISTYLGDNILVQDL